MLETLFGNKTTIQQLQKNNFICNFLSKLSNPSPSLPPAPLSSMRALGNILRTRNRKYNNQPTAYNKIDLNIGYYESIKAKQNKISGSTKPNKCQMFTSMDRKEKFRLQDVEEFMDGLVSQFLDFGLSAKIQVQLANEKSSQDWEYVRFLGGCFRNIQTGFINGVYTNQHNKSQILIKQLQQKDPFLQQLVTQITLTAPTPKTLLLTLFSFYNTKHPPKTFLPSLQQQKNRKICKLLISQQQGNRVLLNRYLYQLNDQQLFQLVVQYDRFFTNIEGIGKVYCVQEIVLYWEKVRKWGEGDGNWLVGWLLAFGNVEQEGIDDYRNREEKRAWEFISKWGYGIELIIQFIRMKIWRWGTVKVSDEQAVKYNQLMRQHYVKQLPQILQILPPNQQSLILHLHLLNHPKYLNNPPQKKQLPLFLLLLLSQKPSLNLLTWSYPNPEHNKKSLEQQSKYRHKLYQKLKQLLHEYPIPASTSGSHRYSEIKQNSYRHVNKNKDAQWVVNFIGDCLPLIGREERLGLLLMNRWVLEAFDWQHLFSLLGKCQQVDLIKSIIPSSIKIYGNTGAFLNTGIPIEQLLPYYEIQMLILGLGQILRQGTKVSQKQKQKYFGMMSIYRGEHLPAQHEFKMTILQTLFQTYLIKQHILFQDYKSLGLCIRCNLEQTISENIQQKLLQSHGLRHSSPNNNSIQRIHNQEYLNKIGTTQFIAQLNSCAQYQQYYVIYLFTLCEAVCKVKQAKQKIIRRVKMDVWVELFLGKLAVGLAEARGDLCNRLVKLRDVALKMFANHGF